MDIAENYPHSLQSEQTILGQMLQHDAASIIAEGATKDWFFSLENQVMFESIRQVFDAGQDISELSVLPVLQSNMAKDRMEVDTAMSLMMACQLSIRPRGLRLYAMFATSSFRGR